MSGGKHITGRKEIDDLVRSIEDNRKVIDRRLQGPARWRGTLLREAKMRQLFIRENGEVAKVFNRLTTIARPDSPVTSDLLKQINREVAGYGEYRAGLVRVGKRGESNEKCPHPELVSIMVERALARSMDDVEPPVLAAARLHMELVLIHPFRDGNGRTARLMSAFILMRAGFRSTLFTAVEQHYHLNPKVYRPAFKALFNAPQIDAWPWLHMALESMYDNSAILAWYYQRESRLVTAVKMLGLSSRKTELALRAYDFGDPAKSRIAPAVQKNEKPWPQLQKQFKSEEVAALKGQLQRVSQEQEAERSWISKLLWRKPWAS